MQRLLLVEQVVGVDHGKIITLKIVTCNEGLDVRQQSLCLLY